MAQAYAGLKIFSHLGQRKAMKPIAMTRRLTETLARRLPPHSRPADVAVIC